MSTPQRTILPLTRRNLADSWRGLLGWTAGVAGAIFLYVPLYSSFSGDNAGFDEIIKSLPEGLASTLGFEDLASGAGYVQATYLGLIGFVLFTIAATLWSSAAIAGDEESGSLELTLAHGVSRVQIMVERSLGVILRLVWLAVVSALLILALNDSSGIELEPINVIGGCLTLLALGVLAASVGLAVGAITGRRAYASAAAAAISLLGYVLNSLGNQSADVEWLHALSPYHWAFGDSPLSNGADGGALALLFGISALALAIGGFVFNRRDVSA
ncbi:ABC transporter permease [Salinibacterium sp. UTAS2018]|uniref:ABC transporter permease subunit n=1 Tax=Salinibacterium sp. UTAS2018 TaxID=2508880 RepID=UPI00100955C5|nr:ABC transporter permease subunit [Salinibacterium sp. UTAS2018]QAV70191.1 ABC transporter permease [Salinibacterium sp. UTAS2018]